MLFCTSAFASFGQSWPALAFIDKRNISNWFLILITHSQESESLSIDVVVPSRAAFTLLCMTIY